MNRIMMLTKAVISLFALSTHVVAAWAPRHLSSSTTTTTTISRVISTSSFHKFQSYNHHRRNGIITATQFHSVSVTTPSSISTEIIGTENTESFRLSFKDGSTTSISPWHNIPMKNDDGTYNMVRFFFIQLEQEHMMFFM